jgi:predicted ABC-type ATPase
MITVIAGVNGAGKSSIAGALVRSAGGDYFNPDEVARSLMDKNGSLSPTEANAQAWRLGFDQLSSAIDDEQDYVLETTLGGNSICQLLHDAIDRGHEVRIFFCGLASPELHIERVAARVAKGGHHIPENKIRERWTGAIHNMLGLIPRCAAISVFDNSVNADKNGPRPVCLFSLQGDHFNSLPIDPMPEWAKPLASAAIRRMLGSHE